MRSIAVLLVSTCALALAACEAPTSHLDEHGLAVAAQQVESLAGESEWLAQQLRARSITANMAWVHQQALGDDAAKVAEQLAKPVPPSLRPEHETVLLLNARLQSQVNRIAGAVAHPDELDALQREFHSLAQRARPIAEKS